MKHHTTNKLFTNNKCYTYATHFIHNQLCDRLITLEGPEGTGKRWNTTNKTKTNKNDNMICLYMFPLPLSLRWTKAMASLFHQKKAMMYLCICLFNSPKSLPSKIRQALAKDEIQKKTLLMAKNTYLIPFHSNFLQLYRLIAPIW